MSDKYVWGAHTPLLNKNGDVSLFGMKSLNFFRETYFSAIFEIKTYFLGTKIGPVPFRLYGTPRSPFADAVKLYSAL